MNNPYTPPKELGAKTPGEEGDATGGLIPYKNPPALIAYYLSIFGMFPCLGVPFSIAALVMGIMGLKKKKENPAVRGTAHAWIGIILGSICTVCHLAGWAMIAMAVISEM